MHGGTLTSPFARRNRSLTLSPLTSRFSTSEATHPSVGSGCHARVPTSYICAMIAVLLGRSSLQETRVEARSCKQLQPTEDS